MSSITQRAFTRITSKIMISFAKSATAEYEKGELTDKSSGGMSFFARHQLKPGSGILIEMKDPTSDPNSAKRHSDYIGEVRWCTKEDDQTTTRYRIGVRLFSGTCALCGNEIHHHHADGVDVCEDCRSRFRSMSKGKIKTCIEKYVLGNVI